MKTLKKLFITMVTIFSIVNLTVCYAANKATTTESTAEKQSIFFVVVENIDIIAIINYHFRDTVSDKKLLKNTLKSIKGVIKVSISAHKVCIERAKAYSQAEIEAHVIKELKNYFHYKNLLLFNQHDYSRAGMDKNINMFLKKPDKF